ncbi:MAG: hypothetical protein VZR23_08140 [Lachnospiraceae bacterium]|jgi:hypothetical protein|nr:hypothetical protein [Lachnospiraceae bacterium]
MSTLPVNGLSGYSLYTLPKNAGQNVGRPVDPVKPVRGVESLDAHPERLDTVALSEGPKGGVTAVYDKDAAPADASGLNGIYSSDASDPYVKSFGSASAELASGQYFDALA